MSDDHVDEQQTPAPRRYVEGTGTWMDGSLYYGPEEFEAEHGMTFNEYCATLVVPTETEQEGRLYRDEVPHRTTHDKRRPA